MYPDALSATAGETLGIANINSGAGGIDLGVNFKGVAGNPLDYFDAKTRTVLEAKLGSFDGRIKRTAIPICGEYNLDVPGTAMGNWIKLGSTRIPEDNNLTLVKDNITPSIQVFLPG